MLRTEDITQGENKNIEFKLQVPERSIKYVKTIAAFANGSGGKIIFGIEDGTCKIVGVNKENALRTCDAIASAIAESISPSLIPDISMHTVDDKTLIVVEVEPGTQRPYFIKAAGMVGGTYIRMAGTTRLADEAMVKELMFEGSNRSYDQAPCLELKATPEGIASLARGLTEEARRNAPNAEAAARVREVTAQQLLSWGVLLERDGEIVPSNAYGILTGEGPLPSGIQCAVFKGKTKAIFVDRREFHGSIQEQIENAYQFVLRNIRLGATFEGIYRRDVYEIPPSAIRELIINAVVHRSYLDINLIQVAVYDDRLEVTSPGRLPYRQSFERMKGGYSKIRNSALAQVFSYMNLIEHWGSGIPRVISSLVNSGLGELDFQDGETDVRISIYRRDPWADDQDFGTIIAEDRPNPWDDYGTKEYTQPAIPKRRAEQESVQKLLRLIIGNPEVTQEEMAKYLGVTRRVITRILGNLANQGVVRREGGRKQGWWAVLKKY